MEPTRHDSGPGGGGSGRGEAGRGGPGRGGARFYAFRAGGGDGGIKDGGPLRRTVGGLSAVLVVVWTLLWLAFYGLIELLGDFLVWLSRTVFEAQDLADFFSGVFGFLQDIGFVTIFVIWLAGVALAIGFNLVTHRATRDAEARWSERHGDRARPVGAGPDGDGAAGPKTGGGARTGGAGRRDRPVTIDLRRDGDTYR